ncbi:MAG: glycosyltransferase [Desulfocapsaceae bacterium]|nr:glycosyltransferase [Desulfosporosinus sp.]MDR3629531.1 glycosyltransferase [Desulfocapsaceae bacterium]
MLQNDMSSLTIPRVSVIIPVRNGYLYICETIDSVLNQNINDLEIIIVDDGSTDYDYTQLESYDSRIQVIRLDGFGVSHARNVGMAASRGEFIAFLDADDVWFPGKLLAQLRYFEKHPEVGVVFGGFVKWEARDDGQHPPASLLMTDSSHLEDIDPEHSGWLYPKLLMGLLVGINTPLIRRGIIALVGQFNEKMRIGEDYEYWLRISQLTQMHALAGPVALYRIHNASAMHHLDKENHLAALLETARKRWGLSSPDGAFLPLQDFRRRLAAVEFSHGYNHYWKGDPATAVKSFAKCLCHGHRLIRSLCYMIMSWGKLIKSFPAMMTL